MLGGVILGLAAHYALPGRHTHGVLLAPALGAVLAAVIWVGLTWLGWRWDGGWIWTVTLVVTGIAVWLADLALGLIRMRSDEDRLVRLSRGAATP